MDEGVIFGGLVWCFEVVWVSGVLFEGIGEVVSDGFEGS